MSPRGRVATGTESNGTRVRAASGGGRGGRRPIPARHAPTVAWPPAAVAAFRIKPGGVLPGGDVQPKDDGDPTRWPPLSPRRVGRTRVAPHRRPDRQPGSGAPVVASSIARVAQLPLATGAGAVTLGSVRFGLRVRD